MSFVAKRKDTRMINVGDVRIGGGSPIVVQSMTNTKTEDINSTVSQILALEKAGCELIRVAVPNSEAALSIKKIKEKIHIPLIADIHFDFRLALESAEAGADCLRINPGNIGNKIKVREVAECASQNGIPIRIGVNAGSLEQDLLDRFGGVTPEAMVESAMGNIRALEEFNFDSIKVSIKASDVARTVKAYRLLSERTGYPLHLGVTEAGSLYPGIVKSSMGIGMLLAEGIGDTIRVSLTRDPLDEIKTAYEILKALGIRRRGPEIVSCPTCGRCNIALFDIVDKVEKELADSKINLKIAIMGCVVNGPGEAKDSDIGIAGGNGVGILFKKGQVKKKFKEDQLVEVLIDEVKNYKDDTTEK